MNPIPPTRQALDQLGLDHEGDLLRELQAKAAEVVEIVPDCVGISVGTVADGVTFTLVANSAVAAAADAVQYVESGPCVEAHDAREPLTFRRSDPLSEQRWQLFAQSTAAVGIESTLTLPILEGDHVVGTVNLYAASADAFEGHHSELADLFGAWAAGAVTNADLSFATRETAELASDRLRSAHLIEVAVGMLAARKGLDIDAARELLEDVAQRAGVPTEAVAALLVEGSDRTDVE